MPRLKQLTCSVECGSANTRLRETNHKFTDGAVEVTIAVPAPDTTFQIRLTSEGYIAPGLAAYVFIDGQYQCNRNRVPLQFPTSHTDPRTYEVDFCFRQKEEKAADGNFIGRAWTFAKLPSGQSSNKSSGIQNANIGTIEVVVLRCRPSSPSHSRVDDAQFEDLHIDDVPPDAYRRTPARENFLQIDRHPDSELGKVFDGVADQVVYDGTFDWQAFDQAETSWNSALASLGESSYTFAAVVDGSDDGNRYYQSHPDAFRYSRPDRQSRVHTVMNTVDGYRRETPASRVRPATQAEPNARHRPSNQREMPEVWISPERERAQQSRHEQRAGHAHTQAAWPAAWDSSPARDPAAHMHSSSPLEYLDKQIRRQAASAQPRHFSHTARFPSMTANNPPGKFSRRGPDGFNTQELAEYHDRYKDISSHGGATRDPYSRPVLEGNDRFDPLQPGPYNFTLGRHMDAGCAFDRIAVAAAPNEDAFESSHLRHRRRGSRDDARTIGGVHWDQSPQQSHPHRNDLHKARDISDKSYTQPQTHRRTSIEPGRSVSLPFSSTTNHLLRRIDEIEVLLQERIEEQNRVQKMSYELRMLTLQPPREPIHPDMMAQLATAIDKQKQIVSNIDDESRDRFDLLMQGLRRERDRSKWQNARDRIEARGWLSEDDKRLQWSGGMGEPASPALRRNIAMDFFPWQTNEQDQANVQKETQNEWASSPPKTPSQQGRTPAHQDTSTNERAQGWADEGTHWNQPDDGWGAEATQNVNVNDNLGWNETGPDKDTGKDDWGGSKNQWAGSGTTAVKNWPNETPADRQTTGGMDSSWANPSKINEALQQQQQTSHRSHHSASSRRRRAHRTTGDIVSPNDDIEPVRVIKPYWADLGRSHNPSDRKPSGPQARNPFIYPAPPFPTLPSTPTKQTSGHPDSLHRDRAVRIGPGATYMHSTHRPVYLDSMTVPYAVFTFHYSSNPSPPVLHTGDDHHSPGNPDTPWATATETPFGHANPPSASGIRASPIQPEDSASQAATPQHPFDSKTRSEALRRYIHDHTSPRENRPAHIQPSTPQQAWNDDGGAEKSRVRSGGGSGPEGKKTRFAATVADVIDDEDDGGKGWKQMGEGGGDTNLW